MKKPQSIFLIKLLVVVAIVGSLTACSDEAYNSYPQQWESDSQESKPKHSTPAEEEPMPGTVPVPNAPAPQEECRCGIFGNRSSDTNNDGCLNKEEHLADTKFSCEKEPYTTETVEIIDTRCQHRIANAWVKVVVTCRRAKGDSLCACNSETVP